MSVKFYQNFAVAFEKLDQFSKQTLKDDLDKAGLIQGFEFTFEQCWKAIQKGAGAEGVKIVSPKSAFSWAMEKGWISNDDEPQWLDMLRDRNLTLHTYREDVAHAVIQNILSMYVRLFTELLQKMKQES